MGNMPSKMSLAMIHFLVQTFGGSTPEESGVPLERWTLQVDDWTPADRSKDFCNLILVLVEGVLMLRISRLPLDEHVRKCLASLMAFIEEKPDGNRITFPIRLDTVSRLKRLSRVVRQVTGSGRRYDNPNWYWVTRRTSKSLLKLADTIDAFDAEITATRF